MQKNIFIPEIEQRLDIFLSSELNQTRSQIAQLIAQSCVVIDGKVATKAGVKLKPNQSVVVDFPQPKQSTPESIDFDVEIIYEDDDLLVINKPSSLTVHPAPSVKEPTLVDWLRHKNISLSTISGEERHGIVHRLDRGTSGAMVVAKNNKSHELLSKQLQDKTMGRYYLAVATPPLKDSVMIVERPIGRSSHNRLKMAIVEQGKSAKSAFLSLTHSNDEKLNLIACKLFSGRTHQIRVHLESMSRHIIGDHLYGTAPKEYKMERILLHSYYLYFIHPSTNKKLYFKAELDDEMEQFLNNNFSQKGWHEKIDPVFIERSFSTEPI